MLLEYPAVLLRPAFFVGTWRYECGHIAVRGFEVEAYMEGSWYSGDRPRVFYALAALEGYTPLFLFVSYQAVLFCFGFLVVIHGLSCGLYVALCRVRKTVALRMHGGVASLRVEIMGTSRPLRTLPERRGTNATMLCVQQCNWRHRRRVPKIVHMNCADWLIDW